MSSPGRCLSAPQALPGRSVAGGASAGKMVVTPHVVAAGRSGEARTWGGQRTRATPEGSVVRSVPGHAACYLKKRGERR